LETRRASRLSLVAFLLALLMTATTALAAVWWNAIDARFVAAADTAGWDESLLLPHQQLLWVAVNGAVVLSVVLTVVTFVALLRAQRSPRRALHAPAVIGDDR
jgi:heme/copper-type cytochrome/quinol oxidase subunit 4